VKRVVKVLGMVKRPCPSSPDHPKVINGCSDLPGRGVRRQGEGTPASAVGMGSLPMQIPVEIEVIVEIEG